MGLRAPKGPNQPMVGTDSLNLYFGPTDTNVMSEEQQLKQMLEAQMVKGIEEQRQNQEMQRAMLEKSLAQGVQPDLSAAWGLVKAAGGDASAASLSPKNLNQDVMALQKELQRTTAGITDDEINLLRAKLMNKQAEQSNLRQARFEEGQANKFFTDFRKDAQKIGDQLADAQQSIINVEAALKPDENGTVSAARVMSALSNYARLMGEKGVLTDQDTGRQLAPTAAMRLAQLENWLKANPEEVRVDAALVSSMMEGLTDAKSALGQVAQIKTQGLRDTYGEPTAPTAPMFYSKGGEKILGKIEERVKKITGPNEAKAAVGPMSEDEFIKKFLEAKKKK